MKCFKSVIIISGLVLGSWVAAADNRRLSPIPDGSLAGVYGVDLGQLGRLIEDKFQMISQVRDISDIQVSEEDLLRKQYITFTVQTTEGVVYEDLKCKVNVIPESISLSECGNAGVRLSAQNILFVSSKNPGLIVPVSAEVLH